MISYLSYTKAPTRMPCARPSLLLSSKCAPTLFCHAATSNTAISLAPTNTSPRLHPPTRSASNHVAVNAATTGGPICTLFAFRSTSPASPSSERFRSFSLASFCDARRASLSFRSFSFRRAFDSNSCQSPSRY